MHVNSAARLALPLALAVLATTAACTDGKGLRAKRVERQDELIGGPTAKGKVGDYLLENDRIRVIVSGPGPTFTAGLFGGTVLDVDLQRTRSQDRQGRGFDAFAEAFPLANLLIVNPMNPLQAIKLEEAGVKVEDVQGAVSVLKDGSDGDEAVIRVTGHSAYIFDVLKFLNRDFIEGLLNPLALGGLELDMRQLADFLPSILEEDINLFGLLNRLQITFNFQTDYTLRPGEPFLRQVTTVTLAPQSARLMQACPPVTCDKTCEFGFAVEERTEADDPNYTVPLKRMCPVCACAAAPAEMRTFNESRDFFRVLLGTLDGWIDPQWKGGVVAGDFLFFGSDAAPFVQGFGFDVDRKVYENMWQGVGTMGSPLSMDWVAGVGENVSYAWGTVNPNQKDGFACPSHRLVVAKTDPAKEDALAAALAGQADLDLAKGLAAKDAAARVRQSIVDRRPIPLQTVPTDATKDPGATAAPDQRAAAYDAWVQSVLAGPGAALQARLPGATVGLLPAHDCMPSRVLVPLFTTSATAVLTHFQDGDRMTVPEGGTNLLDDRRVFTFTRYMSVGEGDVASAVAPLYALRGTPTGTLSGAVYEEGSLRPLSHVDVFLLRDPRAKADDPLPATFREYRRLAQEAFGGPSIENHFQTDPGLDVEFAPDGAFGGPVPPGRYLAMAHAAARGSSALEPVVVQAGSAARVNLVLPQEGAVEFRVRDEGGLPVPARLSFRSLAADGSPLEWDGLNEPELGDARYDHGVVKTEVSPDGMGTVHVPPGRYQVLVSRGFEYSSRTVEIEVGAGDTVPLEVALTREVDTRGWLGGDYHIHSGASVDSALPMELRIRAAAAEGLEMLVASDHDHVLDYQPWILQEGLERHLAFQIAAEVSPLEYGHYNAYPMKFDERKGFVNGAPGWHGLTIRQMWDEMAAMRDGPEDAFVLQVNHPRDGFMGYWAQMGMKGYDLTRKTPGMEMCNQAMEETPCDFDAYELQNGKNLQYLNTPTVGESERHNRCYREILALRDPALLAYKAGASTCAWLLADPVAECAGAAAKAADATLSVAEREAWTLTRDHCTWHAEARESFTAAAGAGDLVSAKRLALEALKLMSVRYQVERTDTEVDAYYNTASEEAAAADATKFVDVGCSHQDACLACVSAKHPECGKKVEDGGAGWSTQCVLWCRDECPQHDARPCTDRFEVVEDWFHLLDVGFDKAAVANSDSHGLSKEIGHPRTYVKSSTDSPSAASRDEINRGLKAGRSTMSSGPFIEMAIRQEGTAGEAGLGEVLPATGTGALKARVKVQTPSWFRIERIEIWSNSQLVKRVFTEAPAEAVVDFDGDIDLPRPDVDSWYVAMAYGLSRDSSMSPVYKREPLGNILISTVISLAADQLLSSFSGLLDKVAAFGLDVSSLTGSLELPDSYPSLAWGATNPVRVDLDGKGFRPPRAVDTNGDGAWDLPAFCSVECDPAKGDLACPVGQQCLPTTRKTGGGPANTCQIPAPAHCVGLQKVSP